MNGKVVLMSLLIALVIVAAVFAIAYVTMPGLAYMLTGQAPTSAQQYGPGQGQGRGMMGGGYNQPSAPNNSAPSNAAPSTNSTPVAPNNSTTNNSTSNQGRGRGMMGGGSTQPAGSLVAVTADGKTIAATTTLPEGTAAQTVGKMNVAITLTPYPPVSFQTGNFAIKLTDDKGQAISDAKISLDLTMPGMWMPPSKPNAQSLGEGAYKAAAPWTMRGLWRIEVIIERNNEKTSAFFDVWL